MTRTMPLLTALVLIAAAGYIHGRWTERWEKSPELEAAVKRLDAVPLNVGNWKGGEGPELNADELAMAGAEGAWIKRFTSTNNDTVLVVLLVGRAGNMSVHKPENCYPGAGYDQGGTSIRYTVPNGGGDKIGECWTSKFVKKDVAAPSQLRIFWTWYAAESWQASQYPRWDFARLPYLYKLYVIRETSNRAEPLEDEPAGKFLQQFLPALSKALKAS